MSVCTGLVVIGSDMTTLGGGLGDDSGVTFVMTTLLGITGVSSVGGSFVDAGTIWLSVTIRSYSGLGLGGGFSSVVISMFNIDSIHFNDSICFSPSCVSGLVGVGLRRSCYIFYATCIATYTYAILGKLIMCGNNSIVSENLSLLLPCRFMS